MKRVLCLLASAPLLFGNPHCLYDGTRDFSYNCTKEYPTPPLFLQRPVQFTKKLFGYPVASSIGIPACAIMTSNGIAWASRAGFDILTYKTVRSHPFNGHPLPNLFVLENPEKIDTKTSQNFQEQPVQDEQSMITLAQEASFNTDSITMANSMGIPSLSLEWVLQDIAKARTLLLPGQLLIVSIIGNPSEEKTLEQDFAYLAQVVVDAGAHVVEANLSCPNLHSPLATYKDPLAVSKISEAIYAAIPTIPFILKMGSFDSFEQMKEVFIAAALSHAKGICGINSLPMPILNHEGNPAFGKNRKIAGVSGNFIRPKAYDFVIQAHRIIQEEHLDLMLLATGGILKPEHFDLFLDAGADVAMSATGAMWNPHLAIEYHNK